MLNIHQRSELTKKYFVPKVVDGKEVEGYDVAPEAKAMLSSFLISPMFDFLILNLQTMEDEYRKQIEKGFLNVNAAIDQTRLLSVLSGKIAGVADVRARLEAYKKGRRDELDQAEKKKKKTGGPDGKGQKTDGG